MVITHINKDDLKSIEPHYTRHPDTTLLFVDISGYTALAQKLGEGKEGGGGLGIMFMTPLLTPCPFPCPLLSLVYLSFPSKPPGSEGTSGTEKLSKSLDAFFNIAITSIYQHGGDVVKFCGDALMCVFLVEQKHQIKQACASAADCCLDLQKKLRGGLRKEGRRC